jgi:PAS domain S-box-containing protein
LRGPRWDVPGLPLFVAVGLAYAAGSQLAIELVEASGLQSVFFIPAGITVAVLLRVPRRQWWLVLLAAGAAEAISDLASGYSVGEALGFALANTVEPLLGAWLVERVVSSFDLARRRDVATFIVAGVIVAPIVGGGIGAAFGAGFGVTHFWSGWWQWAVGDALGVVLVGSAILAVGSSPDRRSLRTPWGALLLVGSAVVAVGSVVLSDLPVLFGVMVGVAVAGVVFGARAVAATGIVTGFSVAVALAFDGTPVINGVTDSTALVLVKAQLGIYAVVGLLVAAEAFEAQLATRAAAESRARADMQDVVRASDARFRSTFENAGVGMAHVGLDGRWLRVNDRLCAILGYTRDELLATSFHTVSLPEDLDADLAAAQQLIAGDLHDYTIEKRCLHRSGEAVWTAVTASLVRRPNGEPDYLIVVVDDISVRKAAEEALRERELVERRAREHAELLAEIVDELEAVDSLTERARRLAELLVPRLADYAAVEGPGPEPVCAIVHRDAAQEDVLRQLWEIRDAAFAGASPAWHATAGAVGYIGEITPEDRQGVLTDAAAFALLQRLAPRSHLAVPLELGGGILGALSIGVTDPDRDTFDDDDIEFARRLADKCSVVLAGAWLREQEHRVSVRLQRALLPDRTVAGPDLAIAARYESASDLLEVGGDWYDVIERADGTVVVAVGDVVGHGLDAAATMGRLRAAFAAFTLRAGSPAQLLADLDAFAQGPGNCEFATVCCAVLEPVTGELRYASAGHPPMLLVRGEDAPRWLDAAPSVPLGTFAAGDRPEAVVRLEADDLVVLYSDGLVERRHESLVEGMERLAVVAGGLRHRSVDVVCDDLVGAMQAASEPCDDVVVVALRYLPITSDRMRCVIPARPDELAPLRAEVRAWLETHGVDADGQFGVLQALNEACANAVEHAYTDGAIGDVEVEIAEDGEGCVRVVVRDHGRWRPPQHHDDSRGRGTSLMQRVSQEFSRQTGPDGTLVTLSVPANGIASDATADSLAAR